MPDSVRPGLEILVSLFAEERIGRPGPAREQALAAARTDPANAHVHLLDAAYASLVAGEPRAADRLLAECEASAPGDETWQRRIAAGRTWSWTVDRNSYPGDVAAEIASYDVPRFPDERPGDPETVLVEAIANEEHALRSFRAQVETQARQNPETALALVGAAVHNAQRLEAAVRGFEGTSGAMVVGVAFADLVHRAGAPEDAEKLLATIRQQDAAEHALAGTFLAEGDWHATPGSSPEALGFDLATQTVPSPFVARRDLARAAAAYGRADELLAGVDEPRAHGALAVRRAALAWLSGDYAAHQALVAQAADAFAAAGDVAAQRLMAVHDLLAEIALGHVSAVRRDAGTGFDLEPRGPIADALRWGEQDGSVSWTTGLGRLFQRAAQRWAAEGDYERAAIAYELAAPLVPASGAESPATVVLELASLDRRNGFGVRALTRCRSAVAALPVVTDPVGQMLDWTRSVNAVLDVVLGQLDTSATAAGMSVPALEWACERVEELLRLPGVPPAGSGRDFDLEAVQREAAARTAEDLRAESEADVSPRLLAMLAGVADTARELIAVGDAYASFQRGKQAAAIGATATADRWYDDALAKVAALPSEAGPQAVVILAARDRFDEAKARLRELLDAADQSPDVLASVAVRARDYETALRLFGSDASDERPWPDLLDHAEAALGAGRLELALRLTGAAVGDFEARFSRLWRDVDRVSVSDDVKVAALYLLATRVHLARAERAEGDAATEIRAHAFELSDRARALALASLLADAADDTDDERLILAWRRTTAEWQVTYERLYRAYASTAAEGEVAARVVDLASAEDALVAVEAKLETKRRRRIALPDLPSLGDVQAALPPNAALVEYQLDGRVLLIWRITATTAEATTSRHQTGQIARLAKAVQRACANGRPGPEADELAAILLAPVAPILAACPRLIVVPYGPLHGLPFQVLPVDGHALGETHVLSYLPAAALLPGRAIDEPLAGRRALVVGDPAFDPAAHPALQRLPGAAVEAGAVAATYRAPALIGHDAAERAIRHELARCDLVHLAAHGRLDPVAPSDSSIVLAGRDELTVSDLVGLRIDSQLAVLSACDSGRGAASLGGDVVGLARGLIAAGARQSVVSLWPVDDAPACVTMSLFHERLAQGLPVAGALHAAQTDVRAMSSSDVWARYVDLGGEDDATGATRRRGAPPARGEPELPLDPEFVDDLTDADGVDALSGALPRVWAPFVVIGA